MTILRKRPSAGAVIGTIALFVALSGSAAAIQGRSGSTAASLTWTKLSLKNGWATEGGARPPAVAIDSFGIVHFRGAMHEPTGNSNNPFRLPLKFRSAKDVYLGLDLNVGNNGQMYLDPKTGQANLEGEGATISQAQQLTSLDGVSFAK